jgi:hypothetical protein
MLRHVNRRSGEAFRIANKYKYKSERISNSALFIFQDSGFDSFGDGDWPGFHGQLFPSQILVTGVTFNATVSR